jgi:hypothetical protein
MGFCPQEAFFCFLFLVSGARVGERRRSECCIVVVERTFIFVGVTAPSETSFRYMFWMEEPRVFRGGVMIMGGCTYHTLNGKGFPKPWTGRHHRYRVFMALSQRFFYCRRRGLHCADFFFSFSCNRRAA